MPAAPLSFEDRTELARREMDAAGLKDSRTAPPAYRALYRLGVPVRPPHYYGFAPLALAVALLTGPAWGLTMWALLWSRRGLPLWVAFAAAGLFGGCMGLALASYFRWSARRHGLSRWEDLGDDAALWD